jgi:hypothetical protein
MSALILTGGFAWKNCYHRQSRRNSALYAKLAKALFAGFYR